MEPTRTRSSTAFCTIAALMAPLALLAAACGGGDTDDDASSATTTSPPPPTTTEPPNPFVGDQAWIAYQTNQSGESVWLMHPDGSEDHRIADDVPTEEQKYGTWSPDGQHLVMTTRGDETEPLYEYDLATDTSQQLFECTDPCLGDDEPVYSPDGTAVLFNRALGPFVDDAEGTGGEVPSDCGLWIGEIATGEVQQLTSNTEPPCDREYFAQWSPDGSHIAYWRDPYVGGEPTGTSVCVYDLERREEECLTDPAMPAGDPSWSPDGEWIAFDSHPLSEYNFDDVVSNLYRMHPDGSGVEQLTDYGEGDVRATVPRYTPDGEWILFTAVTSSSRELWIMPAEGGQPIELTAGGIRVYGTWQPGVD